MHGRQAKALQEVATDTQVQAILAHEKQQLSEYGGQLLQCVGMWDLCLVPSFFGEKELGCIESKQKVTNSSNAWPAHLQLTN